MDGRECARACPPSSLLAPCARWLRWTRAPKADLVSLPILTLRGRLLDPPRSEALGQAGRLGSVPHSGVSFCPVTGVCWDRPSSPGLLPLPSCGGNEGGSVRGGGSALLMLAAVRGKLRSALDCHLFPFPPFPQGRG